MIRMINNYKVNNVLQIHEIGNPNINQQGIDCCFQRLNTEDIAIVCSNIGKNYAI